MTSEILKVGRVIEVSSTSIVGELENTQGDLYRTYNGRRYAVGQVGSMVKVAVGDRLVFGVISALRMTEEPRILDKHSTRLSYQSQSNESKWIEIDLFGEALRTGLGETDFRFQRGVVNYPLPGQEIFVVTDIELQKIYSEPNKPSISVGRLAQSMSTPAYLMTDELLGKHFAVLGTTGTGKSCSVAVILHAILRNANGAHIVLLDPHDEYRNSFKGEAEEIDPAELNLPYWLLNFEESVSLFTGRSERAAVNLSSILRDGISQAKRKYNKAHNVGIREDWITVDTPIPYDIIELREHFRSIRDSLSGTKKDPYEKLIMKVDELMDDKRNDFMFRSDSSTEDSLSEIICQYFRIPALSKPLSIICLSGVSADVVDIVVSLLCRIMLEFAIWSPRPVRQPMLLVCEEAHRYAPSGTAAIHQPAKKALSRIAKEGRKYGVGLGLVSQRPTEMDSSMVSQCNTLIALRMSNRQDQEFVLRALPDSVQGLANILPTLRTQEALIVGEATIMPMRVQFEDLKVEQLPQSMNIKYMNLWRSDTADSDYVDSVIYRWRTQGRQSQESPSAEEESEE